MDAVVPFVQWQFGDVGCDIVLPWLADRQFQRQLARSGASDKVLLVVQDVVVRREFQFFRDVEAEANLHLLVELDGQDWLVAHVQQLGIDDLRLGCAIAELCDSLLESIMLGRCAGFCGDYLGDNGFALALLLRWVVLQGFPMLRVHFLAHHANVVLGDG
ncbi:hypothetical protein D3C81_1532980 [compost metagenome]